MSQAREPAVRNSNIPEDTEPQAISIRARQRLHGWLERHIVADEPYTGEDLQRDDTKERTSFSTGIGLALMLLSAILSIAGLAVIGARLAD